MPLANVCLGEPTLVFMPNILGTARCCSHHWAAEASQYRHPCGVKMFAWSTLMRGCAVIAYKVRGENKINDLPAAERHLATKMLKMLAAVFHLPGVWDGLKQSYKIGVLFNDQAGKDCVLCTVPVHTCLGKGGCVGYNLSG